MTAGSCSMAERGAEGNAGGLVHETIDGLSSAGQVETEHIAESTVQQVSGQLVVGMVSTSGVNDARDGGLLRQPVGEGGGIGASSLHAHGQRVQAALRQPAVERTR